MKRFIEGADRTQVTLLPECLDDYIAEDNPVRVVDAYVEELDLQELGFKGAEPAATGRIVLCRDLKLFSEALVAIDGSKFKAVNSRDRNYTPGKIDKRQQQIEESIQRYLDALETADRTQPPDLEAKSERLKDKIDRLRRQMRQLDRTREQLQTQPDGQLSLTDPDARSMTSHGKATGIVGYNVKAAVDAKHHLIVAHEVTNLGSDRAQLSPMAQAAREAMGKSTLKAVADRGYYNAPQIKAGHDAGIATILPKPTTSNAKAEGRFDKADFVYIARDDEYECRLGNARSTGSAARRTACCFDATGAAPALNAR